MWSWGKGGRPGRGIEIPTLMHPLGGWVFAVNVTIEKSRKIQYDSHIFRLGRRPNHGRMEGKIVWGESNGRIEGIPLCG